MMRLFALLLVPLPAFAECPAAPDHSEAFDALLARVQDAPTEMAARAVTGEMWALWRDAPDEAAQSLLDEGIRARESYNYLRALELFDRLVDYCPDYAEGYNQRAFVSFLREDFAAALPDLDATLDLAPRHVAALAGKALTLIGLGRDAEGQRVLREALNLNPWLSERYLLREPPGEKL
ncbi:tetratricopeptide repeat protein [Litorisediminicola beolgyonensis]|uniref:Tetratricopeptide repeat protein n=1 Tax=Litorisediminicola beolgyonensis TaxID=1173614 RepID=A0ABW3ZLM0_9RHOB